MALFNYQYYRSRIPELDYLRGVAILMVLLSHYPVIEVLTHLWIGVDLFFVLSGYLVARILLKDIEQNGRLRFGRFFIRRGLKIYPSFYVFIFFTVILTALIRQTGIPAFSIELSWQRILAEIFYVQHLTDSVWLHTWTLGVEEQFYILLPLLMFMVMRTGHLARNLLRLMIGFIIVITVFRFLECHTGQIVYDQTHLIDFHFRIDALFLGVAAACIEKLYIQKLLRIPSWIWVALTLLGIAIIMAFAFLSPVLSCQMARTGYTFVNLSFAIWILSVVVLRKKEYSGLSFLKPYILFKPIASIGLYSYNIYLWHAFSIDVLFAIVYVTTKANIFFPYAWRYLAPYLVLSVLMGYIMTQFLEIPILKWRDRKFQ